MAPLSNSLTVLADDLHRVTEACQRAERDAVSHALNAGRMLCEAKGQCQHGAWLPFLKRAGVSERMAQRWMKLHRGRLGSDFVSDLGGVTAALTFLAHRDQAMQHLDECEAANIRFEATGDPEDEAEADAAVNAFCDAMLAMLAMMPSQIAAQDRGEIAKAGGDKSKIPNENFATAADIGLTHKVVHEARAAREGKRD